jgi:predicted DCC family thiol-disulfide oxidoreductase YuxK
MIVIYDGLCNFCNGWVRFLAERDADRVFQFAAAQSPPGENLLRYHGIHPNTPSETILLVDGDNVYTKSEAVIRMLTQCGGGWRLAKALRVVPHQIRDWMYCYFARRRYRLFGKSSTCQLPDPRWKDRFLTSVDGSP